MILKNKKERENFLKNYQSWGVWKEIPELKVKWYKCDFVNGDRIIVTEFYKPSTLYFPEGVSQRYDLIITDNSPYKFVSPFYNEHKNYGVSGCSMSTIVDYLTKCRNCLEIKKEGFDE